MTDVRQMQIRRTKLGLAAQELLRDIKIERCRNQKQASTRVQQPEKERGSAEVKQSYADKVRAERKKAAQARIAARKSGGEVKKDTTSVKDKEKAASKLLAKKTPAKPKTGEKIDRTTKRQYTRDEKKKMVRSGKRLQKDLQKGLINLHLIISLETSKCPSSVSTRFVYDSSRNPAVLL